MRLLYFISRHPASVAFSEQGIHATGRPARRNDSADLPEAFFYVDGPVAGPRFPKPASGVRFLIDVPSLCRPAAGLHAASVRTRVRIPAQGPPSLYVFSVLGRSVEAPVFQTG